MYGVPVLWGNCLRLSTTGAMIAASEFIRSMHSVPWQGGRLMKRRRHYLKGQMVVVMTFAIATLLLAIGVPLPAMPSAG